jgi:hypothetical protein
MEELPLAESIELNDDAPQVISPLIVIQQAKPRFCSICKIEGCTSKKCKYCKSCFKPPGACGYEKDKSSCGTCGEEVQAILKARSAQANAYKCKQKASKRQKIAE